MKKPRRIRFIILAVFLFLSLMPLSALNAAGGHRGSVTSLIHNRDTVISAGEDGFIVIWNVREQAAAERFQLTPYGIKTMVKHPSKDEICIIESAGLDDYRISAWNYKTKNRLFSLYSPEPVTYINYSAGGSFITAAGFEGNPLVLIDSVTGKITSVPDIPAGTVVFAATGRSERNILLYQSESADYDEYEGLILYLDTESASVTGNFQTSGGLSSPVIFGNNRFLAGTSSGGLLVVDAASGLEYAAFENIEKNALLCPADDGFYCLNRREAALYKFSLDRSGRLTARRELSLPADAAGKISSFAYNTGAAFASTEGYVFLAGRQGGIVPMAHNFQSQITEIASGPKNIAFFTGSGELCFLPLDYRLFEENQKLTLAPHKDYSRITHFSGERFVLWQSANTQYAPRIINSDYRFEGAGLNFMFRRFPLRSVSSANNKLLVLDTAGNSSVYSTENISSGKADFSFFSMGAIDSAFVNGGNFILCRSVIRGSSPFLFVNTRTGETVPFAYPAQAGITAYAGNSGNIYAAAVESGAGGTKTTVIGFNLSAAATVDAWFKIIEFPGEISNLSIAESAWTPAVSGGEGAKIYSENAVSFERTEGLPVKLLGNENFFLCLDSEGNISWHNNRTGKLLAVFRLYEDRWTLSNGRREVSGSILRP